MAFGFASFAPRGIITKRSRNVNGFCKQTGEAGSSTDFLMAEFWKYGFTMNFGRKRVFSGSNRTELVIYLDCACILFQALKPTYLLTGTKKEKYVKYILAWSACAQRRWDDRGGATFPLPSRQHILLIYEYPLLVPSPTVFEII
jgi:hypothetical protein